MDLRCYAPLAGKSRKTKGSCSRDSGSVRSSSALQRTTRTLVRGHHAHCSRDALSRCSCTYHTAVLKTDGLLCRVLLFCSRSIYLPDQRDRARLGAASSERRVRVHDTVERSRDSDLCTRGRAGSTLAVRREGGRVQRSQVGINDQLTGGVRQRRARRRARGEGKGEGKRERARARRNGRRSEREERERRVSEGRQFLGAGCPHLFVSLDA